MSKKQRMNQNGRKDANESLGENWTNPFAGLKVDFLAPPAPPKKVEKPKQQENKVELSKEDMELLKAFGGDPSELNRPKEEKQSEKVVQRGYRLTFGIQRKGKGGKTVTLVRGLQVLDIPEQMKICSQIKTALGTGARFAENVLEIQGDQREKAAAWFAKKGFQVNSEQ